MTLTQINARLSLFKDYLDYYLANRHKTPANRLKKFRETGMLFYDEQPLMSIEQFLYWNGHEDLVCYDKRDFLI